MNYNNKKIVIFDWGGVIESHKVNVIERIIKHFNELETENIVENLFINMELIIEVYRTINGSNL